MMCISQPASKRSTEARDPRWGRALLLGLTVLAVLATPWGSHFTFRSRFVCEFEAPVELWLLTAANPKHVISYGLLGMLGSLVFRFRPSATSAIFVVVLSALVELQQAWFADGHCRLRDMLPNVLAVLPAVAVAWWLRRSRRSSAP